MYLIFAFAFRPSKIGMFWGNYKIIETQLTYSVPLPPPPQEKVLDLFRDPRTINYFRWMLL